MADLKLIEPSINYQKEYIHMIEEWNTTGERLVPYVLRWEHEDFAAMLNRLAELRDSAELDERTVNSSTFWLANREGKLLGAVNIRHRLNEYLLHIGGHIGYGIRPSERRKGYATALLKLALIKAAELGIERALVTCDKDNIGSARTIVNNGGVLDSEAEVDDTIIQRYWIQINLK